MKKKAKAPEKENSERWVLTYADVMNLLLIFFIILFVISQVDTNKFNELSQSLGKAFSFGTSSGETLITLPNGGTELQSGIPGVSGGSGGKSEEEQMEDVRKEIEQKVEEEQLGDKIDVVIEERGIKISIKAQYLFPSGSAQINPEVMSNILSIGDVLKSLSGNMIRVEGHTDTDPIKTSSYPSNWELASARAGNVLRILVEKCGISPEKICAVSYGEFQPLVPNDSEVNKAKNRRVDIVILKQEFAIGEVASDN